MTSDEFDNEIRQPLYDLQQKLAKMDVKVNDLLHHISICAETSVGLADDYRIDLLDQEDEEEKRELSQP